MESTKKLVEFILTPSASLATDTVRTTALRCVIDTLAVTLAGHREPGLRALEQFVQPCSSHDTGITVPWSDQRYREDDAALIYGMASHVLDYDDVSMLAVCHPSAPVMSALWAVGSRIGMTGKELLDAYLVGVEVMIRAGQAIGFRHYDLGFHSTATLGVLGSAAACARLLKLDAAQTTHALAIAASTSAGIRKNFGSMVKSLHVGQAAFNGVRAARLAQAGIQGTVGILEGKGWFHVFSGGVVETWPHNLVLGQPFALEEVGFEQKRYPCCYMMHKIIQATLALRSEHELTLEGLQEAVVRMGPGCTAPLIHPFPEDGLSAKFSAPYAVVSALANGYINLESFEDNAVLSRRIQGALPNVTVLEDDAAQPEHGSDLGSAPVTVELNYDNGRRYTKTITASPGSPDDPLTDSDLLEKWRDCVGRGLPALTNERQDALFYEGLSLVNRKQANTWLASFRNI